MTKIGIYSWVSERQLQKNVKTGKLYLSTSRNSVFLPNAEKISDQSWFNFIFEFAYQTHLYFGD